MYPHGRAQAPLLPGQHMKFTVLETLDRIKEEFQLFQAQYHRYDGASLKMECEKLASEKTEMQRHSVMYYEMSYGLNIEMQKQAEIVKRLSAICSQIIPFLSQEHQHQVAQAVERSKHVSMAELNAIIGQQLQHLSHHAPGLPLTPHATGFALGTSPGLAALPTAFGFSGPFVAKDDLSHPPSEDLRDGTSTRSKSASPLHSPVEERQRGDTRRRTAGDERTSAPVRSDVERDKLDADLSKEGSRLQTGIPPSPTNGNGMDGSPSSRRKPHSQSEPSTSTPSPTAASSRHLRQVTTRSPSPSSGVSVTPGSPPPVPPPHQSSRPERTPPPASL
ncbi:TLE family member 2, transcriptional corepressor c isoform X2 [Denticeps clupeoides]|uniref:TLE family member 2, transcriptional corepressor c isoform X2 n=1 Tax=Denticeps clupeoides TaxID=299321 RepID=UPI0010A318F9|nr:transducin-like enhancer protein 4 isoform X2 [Denticeps clupeoides]